MKVSELTGSLLDYWVAKAEGMDFVMHRGHPSQEFEFDPEIHANDYSLQEWKAWIYFQPSSDWAQGGPIIERQEIVVAQLSKVDEETFEESQPWCAWVMLGQSGARHYFDENVHSAEGTGDSMLTAAMRAYVASKYGEEVEDIASR